jgi:hypothetical protein
VVHGPFLKKKNHVTNEWNEWKMRREVKNREREREMKNVED